MKSGVVKSYCFALLFIRTLLPLSALSQSTPKNEFKSSFSGYTMNSALGENQGFGLGITYKRNVSPFFSYEMEYRYAAAIESPVQSTYLQSDLLHFFEPRVLIFPLVNVGHGTLNKIVRQFGVGVGPSVLFGRILTESTITLIYDTSGNIVQRNSTFIDGNIRQLGFVVSLNYTQKISKQFFAGIRADYANYKKHGPFEQVGLFGGVYF